MTPRITPNIPSIILAKYAERIHTAQMSLEELREEYDAVEDYGERRVLMTKDMLIRMVLGMDDSELREVRASYER